jgi:hypothetical protein
MLVGEFKRISDAKKTVLHYSRLLPISLKTAGTQLKRLTSIGHHMGLVKQVAIASLKNFRITDDCM